MRFNSNAVTCLLNFLLVKTNFFKDGDFNLNIFIVLLQSRYILKLEKLGIIAIRAPSLQQFFQLIFLQCLNFFSFFCEIRD